MPDRTSPGDIVQVPGAEKPADRAAGVKRRRRNAAERILEGATACLGEVGPAELSLHEVAVRAGVSKALIHYHYADKESLLVRTVEWTALRITGRQGRALADASAHEAVDRLWGWLSDELERGELRVLVELVQYRTERVQAAIRAATVLRRRATAAMIDRLFSLLALRPRIPPELLAAVVMAFDNGLATGPEGTSPAESRVAFDIFWLSILGLAE